MALQIRARGGPDLDSDGVRRSAPDRLCDSRAQGGSVLKTHADVAGRFQALAGDQNLASAMVSFILERLPAEGIQVLENIGCWLEKKHPLVPRAPHRRELGNWSYCTKPRIRSWQTHSRVKSPGVPRNTTRTPAFELDVRFREFLMRVVFQFFLAASVMAEYSSAKVYYVAPQGDDSKKGSVSAPSAR